MSMEKTRTLEEATRDGRSCLRIVESATTPMGKVNETFDLDRATLEPVARELAGMATVKLNYGAQKVSGEMAAGGQSMAVDVNLKAPVWGDGAAFEVALAGLPLATGYKTTVRIFEPMTQKVRPMALEVTGEETAQVTAGSFPALVVSVKPLDDDPSGTSTCYVLKEGPHHLVKCTTKLPAMMGGGDMTAELKSVAAEVGVR